MSTRGGLGDLAWKITGTLALVPLTVSSALIIEFVLGSIERDIRSFLVVLGVFLVSAFLYGASRYNPDDSDT